MSIITIKIFIEAGEARGGPPLGPVLGQYQIDINSFCKEFNDKTNNMLKGIPVPVVIKRYDNKAYKLKIKQPTINFVVKQLLSDNRQLDVCKLYDLLKISMTINKYDDFMLKNLAKIIFGIISSMKIKIKK
jgi:ribosomal protein L11